MMYFFSAVVAAFGSFIQRVSGFGFGIFAMMFLPLIAGSYGEANALSGMLSLVASAAVTLSMIKFTHWKNIITPVCGSMVFTLLSVNFMSKQNDKVLGILLGAVLILLSVYFIFFSAKIHIKATWWGGLIAGALSGVMTGLFSMGGPPMVVYFMESEDSNERYLATIQAYFFITGVYSTVVKAVHGYVTVNVLLLCAVGCIGLVFGNLTGQAVFKKLDAKLLKRIVYGMMAVAGAVNIVTAVI